MSNGPAAAAPAIFDELVDWIEQMSPASTDDKPLGSGAYSQLLLGVPLA